MENKDAKAKDLWDYWDKHGVESWSRDSNCPACGRSGKFDYYNPSSIGSRRIYKCIHCDRTFEVLMDTSAEHN